MGKWHHQSEIDQYLDYYKTLEPARKARRKAEVAKYEEISRRKAETIKAKEEARLRSLGRPIPGAVTTPPHTHK